MEHRRLGRLGSENSVLIFGGAALAEATEEDSDAAIAQALDAGVDHFDTAADYGDSELQYGRWMPEIRDRIFLSTKTGLREKDAAKRQIQDSLERLRVDNVDLLQLHSVGDIADLDRATGPGSLEAAIEAKEEGLVGAIGITATATRPPQPTSKPCGVTRSRRFLRPGTSSSPQMRATAPITRRSWRRSSARTPG